MRNGSQPQRGAELRGCVTAQDGAAAGKSHRPTLFRRPIQPNDPASTLLTRSVLHERLTAGATKRLTGVVGSARAGKSVLSSWAAARSSGTSSWLSCDEADANPVPLLSRLHPAPSRCGAGVRCRCRRVAGDGRRDVGRCHRVDRELRTVPCICRSPRAAPCLANFRVQLPRPSMIRWSMSNRLPVPSVYSDLACLALSRPKHSEVWLFRVYAVGTALCQRTST